MSDLDSNLITHLEALRRSLLRIFFAALLLYPAAYWVSPYVIRLLVNCCFPGKAGTLYYFSPMEVFLIQLKLALVIDLVAAYPWNLLQFWLFLKPALYPRERGFLVSWIAASSVLFLCGVFFCAKFILPLLMEFSAGFSTIVIRPILGLGNVLEMAGWLMLAFGLMFQMPVVVLLAVRFGIVSCESLRKKRPYVMTVILILAAILTPPDIVSQLLLAIPAWLLFELGLFIAQKMEVRNHESA